MDRSEFIEATGRIEKYFEKTYSTDQLKIMYEEIQNINIDRYKLIIAKLLKTSKYMPKIADILEINQELPKRIKEKIHKECSKCGSTGYLIYKKKIDESIYDFACVCDCGNADSYRGKDYYIPFASEIGL